MESIADLYNCSSICNAIGKFNNLFPSKSLPSILCRMLRVLRLPNYNPVGILKCIHVPFIFQLCSKTLCLRVIEFPADLHSWEHLYAMYSEEHGKVVSLLSFLRTAYSHPVCPVLQSWKTYSTKLRSEVTGLTFTNFIAKQSSEVKSWGLCLTNLIAKVGIWFIELV